MTLTALWLIDLMSTFRPRYGQGVKKGVDLAYEVTTRTESKQTTNKRNYN